MVTNVIRKDTMLFRSDRRSIRPGFDLYYKTPGKAQLDMSAKFPEYTIDCDELNSKISEKHHWILDSKIVDKLRKREDIKYSELFKYLESTYGYKLDGKHMSVYCNETCGVKSLMSLGYTLGGTMECVRVLHDFNITYIKESLSIAQIGELRKDSGTYGFEILDGNIKRGKEDTVHAFLIDKDYVTANMAKCIIKVKPEDFTSYSNCVKSGAFKREARAVFSKLKYDKETIVKMSLFKLV